MGHFKFFFSLQGGGDLNETYEEEDEEEGDEEGEGGEDELDDEEDDDDPVSSTQSLPALPPLSNLNSGFKLVSNIRLCCKDCPLSSKYS